MGDTIADHAKLLALNAAIEAARTGGGAGKSFVDAAEEVRTEQFVRSTMDIKNLIALAIKMPEHRKNIKITC